MTHRPRLLSRAPAPGLRGGGATRGGRSGLAGVVVTLLLAVLGSLLLAPHAAAAPPRTTPPDDVFTAMIERVEREPGLAGRPARYTYTVQVQEVYGDSAISSVRVRVQTTAAFNECATRPESKGSALYVWSLDRSATRLLAAGCRDVLRATELRTAALEDSYGPPRAPTESAPAEPPVELAEVRYACPGSSEELADVARAEDSCDEVAEPRAFDRAAAPGLALIIVGVLGWIVVARLGRSRS